MINLNQSYLNSYYHGKKPRAAKLEEGITAPAPTSTPAPAEIRNHNKKIYFTGYTRLFVNTERAPRPLGVALDFETIMQEAKSKVIGYPPRDFINIFPNQPRKLFEFLDAFAQKTKEIEFKKGKNLNLKKLGFSSLSSLKVKYIDKGAFGKVFKFSIGKKPYVVKAYLKEGTWKNGTAQEIYTGVNTAKEDYYDLGKFHFGNHEQGWGVFEFIDETIAKQKRTQFKPSIGKRRDITLYDNRYGNRIGGVRVDFGEIISSEYERKLPFSLVHAFKNKNERLIAKASFYIHLLPMDKRLNAFNASMIYPESRVNAAMQIRYLKENDMLNAFNEAMKYPESRANAAKQIGYLKKEERLSAFNKAIKYPESREVATMYINYFEGEDRLRANDMLNALNKAMKYPESRANAAMQIKDLKENDMLNAFNEAMKHPDTRVAVLDQLPLVKRNYYRLLIFVKQALKLD